MTTDSEIGECGWCGTPFTQPAWCDHCHEERDHWHETRLTADQKHTGLTAVQTARAALKAARARRQ